MTQEKLLELSITVTELLGRKPTQYELYLGWTISEFPTRKRLDQGEDAQDVADDELDHLDVVARLCAQKAKSLEINLVELTVDLGSLAGLTAAAREHMLNRVRQLVLNQVPELTLYIGWQEDDERIQNIEDRLRDVERFIRA